jgi:hypothetical protein
MRADVPGWRRWYRSGNIVAPDLTNAAALSPAPPLNEAEFAARIAASRPKPDIRRSSFLSSRS